MRIAFLADIHGNLPAFEAALDHVAQQHVDRVIFVGDLVVGSPQSAACWQLACSLGHPMVRGNHERYIGHFGTEHADPSWAGPQYGPVHWAVSQFSPTERQAFMQLPFTLQPDDLPGIRVVHSSMRNDRDSLAPYTSDAELDRLFAGCDESVIVRAHNHVCQLRQWGERRIITCGSVGLPLDGKASAQYLILELRHSGWYIQHQSVDYDLQTTLRIFEQSGYLEHGGPMARLFMREVATGAHQIVPFLHIYRQWQHSEAISLEAAVKRYLETYPL